MITSPEQLEIGVRNLSPVQSTVSQNRALYNVPRNMYTLPEQLLGNRLEGLLGSMTQRQCNLESLLTRVRRGVAQMFPALRFQLAG